MGALRHDGGRLVSQCPPAFTSYYSQLTDDAIRMASYVYAWSALQNCQQMSVSVTPHKGRSYLHTAVNDLGLLSALGNFAVSAKESATELPLRT
jgi:hypothetical protein